MAVAVGCVAVGIDEVDAASRLREGLVGVCGAALACELVAREVPQDRPASLAKADSQCHEVWPISTAVARCIEFKDATL